MSRAACKTRRRRLGAMVVLAIVVLAVLVLLGGELVRTLVLTHRQGDRFRSQSQAFWLAESGVERARAQLLADESYQGETWQPEIASHQPSAENASAAKVTITIAGEDAAREVRVVAVFPDDPLNRVSVERTVQLRSLLQDRAP